MAEKVLAHGIILEVDADGGGYDAVGEIKNIQPPGRTKEDVDCDVLGSTVFETLPSEPPDYGELKFTQIWEVGETEHEKIDTMFGLSGSAAAKPWRISFPYTVAEVKSFSGWVKAIETPQMESKDVVTREVTVRLTTAWS